MERAHGLCEVCNLPATPTDPLEAGHIRARALGGENVLDNYVALHRSENRGEAARIVWIKAAIENRERRLGPGKGGGSAA